MVAFTFYQPTHVANFQVLGLLPTKSMMYRLETMARDTEGALNGSADREKTLCLHSRLAIPHLAFSLLACWWDT